MNKFTIFFICFILQVTLYSQEQETWKFLVEEAHDSSLDSSISRSFMTQLYHRLEVYTTHVLSANELEIRAEMLYQQQIDALFQELENLIVQRDGYIFNDTVTQQQYHLIETHIEEKRSQIDSQEKINIQEIPQEMPLELLSYNQNNPLYEEYQEINPGQIDGIISAEFQGLGENMAIQVYLETVKGKETLFSSRGNSSEIVFWLGETEQALRSLLLGRSWSALKIQCIPNDAAVFSQGELLGVGDLYLKENIPGPLTLNVRRDGYVGKTLELDLQEGENEPLFIELERQRGPMLSVVSEPQGADVYLGSQWVGTTPLELELPPENLSLLISKEGFYQVYEASGNQRELLDVTLRPISGSIEELLKLKKKNFY
ncbi:MAG: PEGA domain-containing protein, partial [Spirochaetaceae bacterium]|nr:PEGA domain-containing protein [Spirochaetaceae bacterium]